MNSPLHSAQAILFTELANTFLSTIVLDLMKEGLSLKYADAYDSVAALVPKVKEAAEQYLQAFAAAGFDQPHFKAMLTLTALASIVQTQHQSVSRALGFGAYVIPMEGKTGRPTKPHAINPSNN